jgi:phosphatidylserine/phosphatidylglycerophosphate/cardiolipin synthase-like enzyme
MPLFRRFWRSNDDDDDSSGDETTDASADALSYVGTAAYDVLRKHHNHHHHELWNVTTGKIIGEVHQTPKDAWSRNDSQDPAASHDDWFPEKMGEIIARTDRWCDVMSLAPPDGLFLVSFKKALATICQREAVLGRVTIRMMFGNIVGMPVNCTKIIKELTKDLPEDAPTKIKLWIGSWRKGVSWNHAKIIAVDGKYLWTGGHNFWDPHYLRNNPVNDLSLEMEGGVARDAHLFANAQWGYVVKKQSTRWGKFVDKNVSDAFDVPRRARVTVSEFPEASTAEFPPYYKHKKIIMSRSNLKIDPDFVPCITMGRYGVLLKKARPSDDAIVAMLDSAKHIIRLSLQDLGPVTIPGTKFTLPGCAWPKDYLNALARVIWTKEVDVEIVLSNAHSIPGNLSATEANYGNGWSCVDVAAEIIKAIKAQFPDAHHGDLREKVKDNLRLCFIRCPRGGKSYKDGKTLGLHCKLVACFFIVTLFYHRTHSFLHPSFLNRYQILAKHFIVDDICCYIGSQNLYICDLAEWGVVIDHPEKVQNIKEQYWDPMWKVCFTGDDCDVDEVMDGLEIDRGAPNRLQLTQEQIKKGKAAMRATMNVPAESVFHSNQINADDDDSSDESEAEA